MLSLAFTLQKHKEVLSYTHDMTLEGGGGSESSSEWR